jgi:hypothetical protein
MPLSFALTWRRCCLTLPHALTGMLAIGAGSAVKQKALWSNLGVLR